MLSKLNSEKGECSIIWKVNNFSFAVKKTSRVICYAAFCLEIIERAKWLLYLVKETETSEDIFFLMKRKGKISQTLTISLKLVAFSPDGNELLLTNAESLTFGKVQSYKSGNLREIAGSLSNILWNDTLVLKLTMKKVVYENCFSKTCSVRTRNVFEEKDFLWTLKTFDSEEEKKNTSIELKSHLHGLNVLKIELVNKSRREYLEIRISKSNDLDEKVDIKCKISLINYEGYTVASYGSEYTFDEKYSSSTWLFPTFIKKTMLIDFIFSLKFELIVYSKNGESFSEQSYYNINNHQESDSADRKVTLNRDILCLYRERKFCDVTLKAGDIELKAHKNILSIRSPIFDSMFQDDLLEKKTGVIKVSDIEPDILKLVIEYIYSDKLGDLELEDTMKLYLAADKYQILSLKDKCSALLESNLTFRNVFRVLTFADECKDDKLKMAVKDFIWIFAYELFDTDLWRNFMVERVNLAAEITREVAMNCLKNL